MPVRKITEYPEKVLGEVGKPVTDFDKGLAELCADMFDTMYDAEGVGLAAPQVGVGLSVAVIEDRAETINALSAQDALERDRKPVPFHVLVNPTIVVTDAAPQIFNEGCLSVAGFMAQVARARAVKVTALDHTGALVTINATGWYARILQHEIDHLHGDLYIDKMNSRSFSGPTQPPARKT